MIILGITSFTLCCSTTDSLAQTFESNTIINKAVAAPPDGGGTITKRFKCFPMATPPYRMCAYS